MADSPVFDFLCARLDAETTLSLLEARGTIRLALRDSGLTAASLVVAEAAVVLEKVLPGELSARGIKDSGDVCERIADGLAGLEVAPGATAPSPDSVFARLGR